MNRNAIAVGAWACALLVLGSLGPARAWSALLPALALAAAAVVPLLVLRGVLRLGVSRWASASVLALLLVLLGYLLSARAGTPLVRTVTDAIPMLLTEPQPLAVRADLLAAPVLLCGVVGLLVGLRLDKRGRVAPVAGAAVLHVAGLLLTSGSSDPYGLLSAALVVVSLAGWVLLDDHASTARTRIGVLGPVAALAVGAVAFTAAVPVSNAFDPRSVVRSPLVQVTAANPMPQLGAWSANPQREIIRVTGPEAPLRLVTLTDFDGVHWSSATRFARLGSAYSSGPPAGIRQEEFTHRIELLDLTGPWLPVPGAPEHLSSPEALADPTTGTVYLPGRPEGFTYTVTGRVDAPTRAQLSAASVPVTGRFADYLAVPDLPYALAEYAAEATRGAATAYDRALAVEAAVRGDRDYSPTAISGSAYWRIERFLLGSTDQPGGQVGGSEQFATAFAVIARQSGLPTRVVVGFRPGTAQPDGSRIVHGEDAMAWPEVYFEGLGWVPFSPLPDDPTFAHEDVDDPPRETTTPTQQPSDDPSVPEQLDPHQPGGADSGEDPAAAPAGSTDRTLLLAVGLAALVLAPLCVLWLLRAVRRLRHRRRGARGAWAEVLDAFVLAGIPLRTGDSATDVALRAEAVLGTPAAGVIAERAERAAYAPAGTPVEDSWPAEVADVRRAARSRVPWWRRWWWSLDPRPLRR
ncbi:transglutaminaseTgpA domain-containing protein [Nocardioides sp. AE5]|uniref:DUF3488 and transglutaminase-like domain-containing protein n=1 Tax=Nocardioides sp. AE5 TaxID=2962573 RepID=UPI002882783A|nr:transglutaminaseTgpA domain-containing protein [Nocardioides sp. AE5]MDT0202775.1 transglutaminaseTgpA domain-containing protein [Nocardioides sp. AE5]